MTGYPERKHSAVMREFLTLREAQVLDVGCGDGALVRFMTREGARVVGLECSQAQLAAARAATATDDEAYVFARGEALPFAQRAFDLLVFFNSLHHVPVEAQSAALAEAARVLAPGGRLYIMEPLAEGAYFELMKPLHDETHVRARAYEAIRAATANGAFRQDAEDCYAAPFKHDSFASCKARMLAIDPGRAAAIQAHEQDIAEAFEVVAQRRDGAFWFVQPSRLNLLRRL